MGGKRLLPAALPSSSWEPIIVVMNDSQSYEDCNWWVQVCILYKNAMDGRRCAVHPLEKWTGDYKVYKTSKAFSQEVRLLACSYSIISS